MTVSDKVLENELEEKDKERETSTFLSVLSSCTHYSLPSISIGADSPPHPSLSLSPPCSFLMLSPKLLQDHYHPLLSPAASFIHSLTPSDAFVPHFSQPASRSLPHPPSLSLCLIHSFHLSSPLFIHYSHQLAVISPSIV